MNYFLKLPYSYQKSEIIGESCTTIWMHKFLTHCLLEHFHGYQMTLSFPGAYGGLNAKKCRYGDGFKTSRALTHPSKLSTTSHLVNRRTILQLRPLFNPQPYEIPTAGNTRSLLSRTYNIIHIRNGIHFLSHFHIPIPFFRIVSISLGWKDENSRAVKN